MVACDRPRHRRSSRWSLPQREARGADIRDLVVRNGVPHVEFDTDSPGGEACLREHGLEGTREPVVVVHGRATLRDPTRQEVARALGVETDLGDDREFDVLIVGAGPAGLATAVYASSEGLSALVVERDAIGGQAGTSSLIRNYLGFSRGISGAELAQRSLPAGVGLRHPVPAHARGARRCARTATGQRAEISGVGEVRTRATVLAGGVTYRRLARPVARPPESARASSTARRRPRPAASWERASSSSAAATPPGRPRCTSRATPSR